MLLLSDQRVIVVEDVRASCKRRSGVPVTLYEMYRLDAVPSDLFGCCRAGRVAGISYEGDSASVPAIHHDGADGQWQAGPQRRLGRPFDRFLCGLLS